jgi:hypothetical protein
MSELLFETARRLDKLSECVCLFLLVLYPLRGELVDDERPCISVILHLFTLCFISYLSLVLIVLATWKSHLDHVISHLTKKWSSIFSCSAAVPTFL